MQKYCGECGGKLNNSECPKGHDTYIDIMLKEPPAGLLERAAQYITESAYYSNNYAWIAESEKICNIIQETANNTKVFLKKVEAR